jgi:putative membrane protein
MTTRTRGSTTGWGALDGRRLFLKALLAWYVLLWAGLSLSPVDEQHRALASMLPGMLVAGLVATHRVFLLSHGSYVLITLFLTLHTIGAHDTYAQVPFGDWLARTFEQSRNLFDWIVHCCFGLLLTSPLREVFLRLTNAGWGLAMYLSVMTPLGLSGLWEVLESWVARIVSPQVGVAYQGAQSDIWDASQDMTAVCTGAVIATALTVRAARTASR